MDSNGPVCASLLIAIDTAWEVMGLRQLKPITHLDSVKTPGKQLNAYVGLFYLPKDLLLEIVTKENILFLEISSFILKLNWSEFISLWNILGNHTGSIKFTEKIIKNAQYIPQKTTYTEK